MAAFVPQEQVQQQTVDGASCERQAGGTRLIPDKAVEAGDCLQQSIQSAPNASIARMCCSSCVSKNTTLLSGAFCSSTLIIRQDT